ncbi:hypothetical protein BGW39_011117 [Mortierella sp. 14UC]|nr:hypothetical protein BGW39_011117 [Mortierella sp. 14UC]
MKVAITILAALSMAALTSSAAHPRPEGQDTIGRRLVEAAPRAVRAALMHPPTVAPNDMKKRAKATRTKPNTDDIPKRRAAPTATKTPDPL